MKARARGRTYLPEQETRRRPYAGGSWFIEALGQGEGARYALLHAFSALDPPDRLLAVRELVSKRS